MAYQALYRALRPQTFAEVVGQPHIVRTLQNMLRQGRVYHAFLFCGPRGTGKTTLAKLLAKALNCQQGLSSEPCQVCPACIGIKAGNYVDVLEIDGASNRGIDEIRELRERIKYAPAEGRYKVYIIDEVHMLTTEAFNALLKTLEEPPAHVVFVFATTEAQKVPATILSRCQRFDFRRISSKVIAETLADLCAKNDIAVLPAALQLIASAANGGMRDALSMLDQARSYAGEQAVTAEDVSEVVGLVADAVFQRLIGYLAQADLASALDEVHGLVERGREITQITDGLLQYARTCLLHGVGLAQPGFVAPDVELPAAFLMALLQALLAAEKDLRYASNQQVLLELALFRAAASLQPLQPGLVAKGADVSPKPQSVAAGGIQPKPEARATPASASVEPPLPEEPGRSREAANAGQTEPSSPLPGQQPLSPPDRVSAPAALTEPGPAAQVETGVDAEAEVAAEAREPQPSLTFRRLSQGWPGFVAKVSALDPSIGAPLANGQIKQLTGQVICLQFEKGFHRKVVNDHLHFLLELLQREFQQPLRLDCLLQSEAPVVEQVSEKLSEDEAERIALSLFEGQEVDSKQIGGPK